MFPSLFPFFIPLLPSLLIPLSNLLVYFVFLSFCVCIFLSVFCGEINHFSREKDRERQRETERQRLRERERERESFLSVCVGFDYVMERSWKQKAYQCHGCQASDMVRNCCRARLDLTAEESAVTCFCLIHAGAYAEGFEGVHQIQLGVWGAL